ncbi:hypothetical protein N0V90_009563 [Kalmusia sp. IMI 367209]|nr:hypothetical protein N0V90_009563 [Kalmusia sp. IMI 367209]
MPPIRIALIGLSAGAITTWAASAHLPYLLSSHGRQHYEIVALLNSSVAAASSARQTFNLPPTVKTYGTPSDLAQDAEVDLVVCCTRVDVHFDTILPSIQAGKALFVEWPLAENLARCLTLVSALPAAHSLTNSIVGLQGRVSPVTLRLKALLASGAIGNVLSAHVLCYGALLPRDALPESMQYFAERRHGGNPIVIENGHCLDWVHEVLGEYQDFATYMQIQRPVIKIVGEEGETLREVDTDVPDLLSLQGRLGGREGVVPGALLTHVFRHGTPFRGRPGLEWIINGEKGEVRVEMGEKYLFLEDPVRIEVHHHGTDEVRAVEWDWEGGRGSCR